MSGKTGHLKATLRNLAGKGYDPKMLESCFDGGTHHNPNQPGPGRSVEDCPEHAKFIDELLAERKAKCTLTS